MNNPRKKSLNQTSSKNAYSKVSNRRSVLNKRSIRQGHGLEINVVLRKVADKRSIAQKCGKV